jgi:hypothetical protein
MNDNMNDKELAMYHANDRLASRIGKARKSMTESVSLLHTALHAHQRGDKAHVVADHLERVIDALTAALAATHNKDHDSEYREYMHDYKAHDRGQEC